MQPIGYNLTLSVLFVGAAALGVWFLKWKKDWPLLDRMVAAPLAVGFIALLGMMSSSVLQAPFFGWNAARLAPTFALANGYRLYYPDGVGPVLNTIYGPVTALVYLPAALAGSPSTALVIASAVSVVLFFGPVLWLAMRGGKGVLGWAALLCFGFLAMRSYSLRYGAFCIHADAPALGLGGLACAAIYLRRRDDEWTLLSVSAVAAVLSVWSKQTMVLLPVALAVCVWWLFGVASLKRYLLVLGGVGLVLSLVFLLSFGPSAMLFNMAQVPSRHPWQGGKLEWLQQASQELVTESLFPLGIIAVGLLVCAGTGRRMGRWLVFAIVGALNAPTAILNRVKVGGDMNAFNLSAYFWLIGALLLLVEMAEEVEEKGMSQTVKAVLAVLVIGLLGGVPERLQNLYQLTRVFRLNQQEAACQTLRQNPGLIYFPNNPLAHLMVEHKVYHLSWGVIDRKYGGYPVGEQQFRANVPLNMKAVLFGSLWSPTETQTHEETMRYLPGFVLQGRDPSGWTIYLRPN
jgi:hypothetical protein